MPSRTFKKILAASSEAPWTLVALAVVVGVGLRLWNLWALHDADPLLIHPVVDAAGYHRWALQIVGGHVDDQPYFQSPGYPYTLAILYWALRASPVVAAVFQCLVAGVGIAATAAAAAQLSSDAARARFDPVWAAWLMALYGPLIFYDAVLLKVELTVTVAILCLVAYQRGLGYRIRGGGASDGAGRRAAFLALAGALLALAGLYRGNFLIMVVPLAAWIGIRWFARRSDPLWRDVRAVVAAALLISFLGGFAAVVTCIAARNYVVSGDLVLTNSNSGVMLYVGNNPYSPKGDWVRFPFVRANPVFEEEDLHAEAERRAGRPLTASEASAVWREQALEYIAADPLGALGRVFRKGQLVVESFELGDNYSMEFHSLFSPVLALPLLSWPVLLALALVSLMSVRSRWRELTPVLVVLAMYVTSMLITVVRSRYRVPMVPFLAVLAALEIGVVIQLAREEARRRLAVHAGFVLLILAVSFGIGLPRQAKASMGAWWGTLGGLHAEAGDPARGQAYIARGLELEPDNPDLWMNSGRIALGAGSYKIAAERCSKAVALRPSEVAARECAAFAELALGRPPASLAILEPALVPPMPTERALLGAMVLDANGQPDRARRLLEAHLEARPNDGQVHARLAGLLRGSDPQAARIHLERALELASGPEQQRLFRALFEQEATRP